jgi:hypothetical protein
VTTTSLPEHVLERFYYDWVLDDGNITGEKYHEFIPRMYNAKRHDPESGLVAAVSALALINYAKRCKSPELIPQAREHYSKAMMIMRRILADPNVSSSDDILVTIYTLGWYEVCANCESFIDH